MRPSAFEMRAKTPSQSLRTAGRFDDSEDIMNAIPFQFTLVGASGGSARSRGALLCISYERNHVAHREFSNLPPD